MNESCHTYMLEVILKSLGLLTAVRTGGFRSACMSECQCKFVSMWVCVCVCVCVCMRVHACMCACARVRMYTHARVHAYACMCTCVCVHVYPCQISGMSFAAAEPYDVQNIFIFPCHFREKCLKHPRFEFPTWGDRDKCITDCRITVFSAR